MVQPMDDDIFICTEQVNRPLEGIGRRPLDLAASPSSSPTFPLRPGSYYNGQQRFADMHTRNIMHALQYLEEKALLFFTSSFYDLRKRFCIPAN